jgi:pentatricopeptide repeat protein
VAEALDAFHGAITAAQALGSVKLAAEAAVRIAPHAISDGAVIGALDDALCDLPDDDSSLRAQVLVSFARVMQSSSVGGDVLRNVNRMGLEMARRIGDPETLWTILWRWHQNGFNGIEPVEERMAVARELVAMAEEAGDRERVAFARTWLAVDLYEAGRLVAARAELGAVLRDADDLRQPFLSWAALAFAAQVALFEGRLEEAEALARQALDAGSECRTVSAEMIFQQQLAAVRRHQGRFGELEQIARGALTHWSVIGFDCRHNPLLVGLAGLGRVDEARALVEDMLRNGVVETLFPVIVPDSGRSTTGRLCCPIGMADVLWALDDVERAGPLYEMLLPSASRHVLIMEAESRGVCALYLGQLATLLGRFEEAGAHFRMAHELHDRIGARVWAAHGRVDHARMLIRRQGPDDRAPALALLTEARASYHAMTMDFYAAQAAHLLGTLA